MLCGWGRLGSRHGIALGLFRAATDVAGVAAAAAEFGYPVMLKSRRLAYDGRGNAVVHTADGTRGLMRETQNRRALLTHRDGFAAPGHMPQTLPAHCRRLVAMCTWNSGSRSPRNSR